MGDDVSPRRKLHPDSLTSFAGLVAGESVLWLPEGHANWRRATVRAVDLNPPQVWMDDGDRQDPDLATNGYTIASREDGPRRIRRRTRQPASKVDAVINAARRLVAPGTPGDLDTYRALFTALSALDGDQ